VQAGVPVRSACLLMTDNANLFLQQLVQHWSQHQSVLRAQRSHSVIGDTFSKLVYMRTCLQTVHLVPRRPSYVLGHDSLWFASKCVSMHILGLSHHNFVKLGQ
jgi:hypothetical protein